MVSIRSKVLSIEEKSIYRECLQSGHHLLLDNHSRTARALEIARLHASGYHLLCISPDSEQQSLLMNELLFFTDEEQIACVPSWETLPGERADPSSDIVGLRMKALWQILQAEKPQIILASVQSFQQRTPNPQRMASASLVLQKGTVFGMHALIERLNALGYQRVERVVEKGQFAPRTGLIDLFAPHLLEPTRIEWWGDEIDQLRSFDPSSQCSLKPLDQMTLLAAVENFDPDFGLIDYIPKPYLCVFEQIAAIEDRYVSIDAMPSAIYGGYVSFEKAFSAIESPIVFMSQLAIDALSSHSRKRLPNDFNRLSEVSFEIFSRKFKALHPAERYLRLSERFSESGGFGESLSLAIEEKFQLTLLFASQAEYASALKLLAEASIALDQVDLQPGYLSQSIVFEKSHFVLAPMAEYTHSQKVYRPKLRITHSQIERELLEIEPGDFVVHLYHGIGRYRGNEKRANLAGEQQEFLTLEYANGSKIYVPIEHAYLLTRYQAVDSDRAVELHQLGSTKWKKQWALAQASIQGYARKLLELYASRQIQRSPTCLLEDSLPMQQFEADFPYEVTQDQQRAIEAIKADLAKAAPMDRLICGDVGYGKTEVAMRAAFKIIIDGGCQVALLAPTTVLALQHFETFSQRMGSLGVRLAILSRFTKAKERRLIIEELKLGQIDLLIGTHRLLGKEVKFHNLGLVIIDEEQRFGVKAKEHLKHIQRDVNCLTLSATPIPRTLHLSLMGAKELSAIATAPHDRQPITTLVCQKEETTLLAALSREVGRGGQAFFVHNDINALPLIAHQLQKLLPSLRIGTVHGQMSADEIENAFHQFKSHEIDLLVATTIVETGIDIPNANTIFIDHADEFGLADLYQLRGRVGRWNRKAYAYLLYPAKKTLSPIAKKRLEAIQAASGYGAGMKLAVRDLEIRGCGQLLGEQQSGHLSTIGFSLYSRLLQRTMQRLQGQEVLDVEQIRIDHNFPSRLPSTYIESFATRLEIYQRAAVLSHCDQIEPLRLEIIDRFGAAGPELSWLLALSRIRMESAKAGLESIKLNYELNKQSAGATIEIEFERGLGAGRSQKVHINRQIKQQKGAVDTLLVEWIIAQIQGQPSPSQPSSGQPSSGQPSSGQPSSGQPSSGQPSSVQLSGQQILSNHPAVEAKGPSKKPLPPARFLPEAQAMKKRFGL